MNAREYAIFLIVGILALMLGGVINQALGIAGSSNIVMQLIALAIPLTILYIAWYKFVKKRE